jgi:hypothetical protein
MYKGGGNVQQTYGLRNAAEQLRKRGRGDDTILAHITPQEAGILKLLGGSGTINPYTGLPEYRKWYKDVQKAFKSTPIVGDIYKGVSSIGKEVERGVESIAKDPILGPIARIASYVHPVSAFLYAGLAPEGSSFDTKGAAKAAAMQQIGQAVKEYAVGNPQGGYGPDFNPDPYGPGGIDPTNVYSDPTSLASQQAFDAGIDIASAPSIGAVEGAVASAVPQAIAYPPDPNSYVSGANAAGQVASADVPFSDAAPASAPAPAAPTAPGGGMDMMGADYDYGQGAPIRNIGIDSTGGLPASPSIGEGILGLGEATVEAAYGLASRNPLTTLSLGTTAYGAYKTKQELDDAKAEADQIMSDQANRKAEEVAWAQSVLRDYPYNYQRLTEEDVRRERGMAMGGRITSYDDEIGGDDNMMQGGIAALAKGGLPPRYLRGGGDGMSDSIRASIEGKQEARLADGEFVVPADVVSHLGNGSSNAGAKKLYSMMDRVRRSRTGKTRQAPEVNTRRLMPA